MRKPAVLVFIDWYAPGFKAGGPVRSLVNLVDHLRDRADLHIVTTDTDYTEKDPYAGITADRWTALPGGEHVWYASRKGIHMKTWTRLLSERPWDVVYINGMYSWWFSVMPLWLLRGARQRRIVAVRGMLARGMMRHGALKKRLFLSAMRWCGCYKGVEFQATNSEEAGDVRHWISPEAQVHLVPNLGRKLAPGSWPVRVKRPGQLRLVSVARVAVEKNTLYAIERLAHAGGDVTFDLFGPIYDEAYWQRCQQAIAALPSNVKVHHKGIAHPEEVPMVLTDYHALFMPSQGENFGHSMAEALSTGLPLLISDRTPWRGLEEQHAGWDLPLEDPGAFSSIIQQLVQADQAAYDQWSAGAFTLGARYLDDRDAVEKSFAMFTP